jgi:hypothetical protein
VGELNKKQVIITVLIAIVFFLGFVYFVGKGLDKSEDEQNQMLCESALESRNEKYLNNCQWFYETGQIEYMRGH